MPWSHQDWEILWAMVGILTVLVAIIVWSKPNTPRHP